MFKRVQAVFHVVHFPLTIYTPHHPTPRGDEDLDRANKTKSPSGLQVPSSVVDGFAQLCPASYLVALTRERPGRPRFVQNTSDPGTRYGGQVSGRASETQHLPDNGPTYRGLGLGWLSARLDMLCTSRPWMAFLPGSRQSPAWPGPWPPGNDTCVKEKGFRAFEVVDDSPKVGPVSSRHTQGSSAAASIK